MAEKTDPTINETSVLGDQRKRLRSPLLITQARMDSGGKVFFGYAKNLSRGGIFIATINPREPGSQFQLEIDLPSPLNIPIRCSCQVVWKREFSNKSLLEPGMGLKFLDVPEEIAERIDLWIKKTQEDE
jgi:uncharacterized protein (TIGR02266 family)